MSWVGVLVLLFVVGVIGNAIVVAVYQPSKSRNVHVYFVFVLGIIDLISSFFRES